jgi:hypothetical protein
MTRGAEMAMMWSSSTFGWCVRRVDFTCWRVGHHGRCVTSCVGVSGNVVFVPMVLGPPEHFYRVRFFEKKPLKWFLKVPKFTLVRKNSHSLFLANLRAQKELKPCSDTKWHIGYIRFLLHKQKLGNS